MTRTKTRTEFVNKCKKKMHKHLENNNMIITYLRESNPRGYGVRPTAEDAEVIRDMLNAAPDMTPDGYIKMLEATGSLVPEHDKEDAKKMFLTARSYWRARRTPRVGVVVAFKKKGIIYIGWSLCKTSAGDKFDRYIGVYESLRKDDDGNYLSAYPLDNPEGIPNLLSTRNIVVRTKSEMARRRQEKEKGINVVSSTRPNAITIPHTLLPHVEAMMVRAEKQLK